ncbi:SCO2400 family protein, partial [Streptomyces viridochromogenes]|uniref:SCO2400 family protein n=2 Tax=Streptomyces TaxID=1883 RepID=UPI003CD0B44A
MDYCHPCRRHLNGALACPGCGATTEQPHVYADAMAGAGYPPPAERSPGAPAAYAGQYTGAEPDAAGDAHPLEDAHAPADDGGPA